MHPHKSAFAFKTITSLHYVLDPLFPSRLQVYLPRPSICPKEIYDLMTSCWLRHEPDRPSFREIYVFLHRKNMGYQNQ